MIPLSHALKILWPQKVVNEEDGFALPGPSATFGGPPEPPDFDESGFAEQHQSVIAAVCDTGLREAQNCLYWMGEEDSGFQSRYPI